MLCNKIFTPFVCNFYTLCMQTMMGIQDFELYVFNCLSQFCSVWHPLKGLVAFSAMWGTQIHCFTFDKDWYFYKEIFCRPLAKDGLNDESSSSLILQIQEFLIKNSDGSFTISQDVADSNIGILYTQSAFDRESVDKDKSLVKTLIIEAIDASPSSLPNAVGHNTGKTIIIM